MDRDDLCPESSVSPATTSLTIVILSRKDKEHLLQDISRVRQNTYTRSRPLYSLSLSEYFHHRCHIYQPYKHYHFHACFLHFHMRTTCIHPRAIETDQKTVYDIRGATCISDAVFVVFANAFYRNLIWKMCSFAAVVKKEENNWKQT